MLNKLDAKYLSAGIAKLSPSQKFPVLNDNQRKGNALLVSIEVSDQHVKEENV